MKKIRTVIDKQNDKRDNTVKTAVSFIQAGFSTVYQKAKMVDIVDKTTCLLN